MVSKFNSMGPGNNNGEARSGVVPYGVTEQGKTEQREVLTVEPVVVAK